MSDNSVTPAEQFRKAATKVIGPLPVSDARVRIRKIRNYDILTTGQLFADVSTVEGDRTAVQAQVEQVVAKSDQLMTLEQYFEIVKAGMVEPRMVTGDYDDADISLNVIHRMDIEDDDLIFIGDEIMRFSGYGGTAEAAPFPEEPGTGDVDTSDGEGVRVEAKRSVEK